MQQEKYQVNVNSEIGELEAVIVHSMGSEVENMTPENAERALYSDILNLNVAQKEYLQFREVLKRNTRVFEVRELLEAVLENDKVRSELLSKVCRNCVDPRVVDGLREMDKAELSRRLIEGVVLKRDNLTRFLSSQRFALRPLHNSFFTRDASIAMYDKVLISKMASQVRERESQIMEAIFDYYPPFKTSTFGASENARHCKNLSIEGGDVLIGKEDLLLIGIGSRTTSEGVDLVIEKLMERKKKQHIIVQELPTTRESFIHLDMVFTFLSQEECMVFEPVILQPNRYKTIHITIDNGKVRIREEKNILETLGSLGMNLTPIHCGGKADPWTQEREQWHSGANFFALAPGKVIGYSRNTYTIDEMAKHGYEVVKATDIITEKAKLSDFKKCVVTIEGTELARGGGGARCMSMPVRRKAL